MRNPLDKVWQFIHDAILAVDFDDMFGVDCEHEDTWFDRSYCFCVPQGTMHEVCSDCGRTVDDDVACNPGSDG